MQYRLLASDFDNTLVPFGQKGPSEAVEAAVGRLRAQGVRFVLCTGRALCALRQSKQLLGGLRYDFAVCSNGAHVVDAEGRTLAQTPLTSEEMYALVDFCEDYDYPLQFAFSEAYYAYVGYENFRAFNEAHPAAGLITLDGEDQDRHLFDMPRAAGVSLPVGGLERFEKKYGYLNLAFLPMNNLPADGWISYDVMRGGVDKSTGLAALCSELGIPMAAVAAAGDDHNDCGMLRAAGLGCAMGNAAPEAKRAADRVIGDVREDGLAKLIDELWPEDAEGAL